MPQAKRRRRKKLILSTLVPSGWKGTPHEWRMAKRGEWQLVMRALMKFTWGCAYTPCGTDLYDVQRAAERITEAMSEDWVVR